MTRLTILLTIFYCFTLHAANKIDPKKTSIPGEYVVQLNESIRKADLMGNSDFKIVEFIDEDLAVISRPPLEKSSHSIHLLRETKLFKIIEPNFIYTINNKPNDPDFSQAWGLNNFGQEDSKGNRGVSKPFTGKFLAATLTFGSCQRLNSSPCAR